MFPPVLVGNEELPQCSDFSAGKKCLSCKVKAFMIINSKFVFLY